MAFIEAYSDEGFLKGNRFFENLSWDLKSKIHHLKVFEDLKSISVVLKDDITHRLSFILPERHQIKSVFADQNEGIITIICEDKAEKITIRYIIKYEKLSDVFSAI